MSLAYVDLYLDDFIGMAQATPLEQKVQSMIFHTISHIFHDKNTTDHSCKQPISETKLVKGDANKNDHPWVGSQHHDGHYSLATSLGQPPPYPFEHQPW